jgi:hypothetical protein
MVPGQHIPRAFACPGRGKSHVKVLDNQCLYASENVLLVLMDSNYARVSSEERVLRAYGAASTRPY